MGKQETEVSSEETFLLPNITSTCDTPGCDWEITGPVEVILDWGVVPLVMVGHDFERIEVQCRFHHMAFSEEFGEGDHNRFVLKLPDNTIVGSLSASSEAIAGGFFQDKFSEIKKLLIPQNP